MNPPSILVVDDEPTIRELVCEILRMKGFVTIEAESGCLALERASEHHPEAMVLDLMLPDVDGFQVCARVKSQLSDPPGILILTGKHGDATRRQAFEVGADRYMAKPFSPADLVNQVEILIAARKSNGTSQAGESGEEARLVAHLDTKDPAEFVSQIHALRLEWVRTTPLGWQEIDGLVRAMLLLGDRSHPSSLPGLTCQVFADRLEVSWPLTPGVEADEELQRVRDAYLLPGEAREVGWEPWTAEWVRRADQGVLIRRFARPLPDPPSAAL